MRKIVGAMSVVTIYYAIVALVRLIILSVWLIRLLALQLSLTLASFCAPDESRMKKVITGNHFSCTTLRTPSLLFQASWVSLKFPSNVSHCS